MDQQATTAMASGMSLQISFSGHVIKFPFALHHVLFATSWIIIAQYANPEPV